MIDHHARVDELLAELSRTLAVRPSDGFADGVRRRVSTPRTFWRWVPLTAAAAGLVIATMWGVAAWNRSGRGANHSTGDLSIARVAAPDAPSPAAPSAAPVPDDSRPTLREASRARPAASSPQAPVQVAADTADPAVITNQAAVLRQLWTRALADHADSVKVQVAPDSELPEPAPATLTVEPLTVAPIVVTRIGDRPPEGGGRSAGAESNRIRRFTAAGRLP